MDKEFSNLNKRIISALILIPAILILIHIGGFLYNSFVITTAILLTIEILSLFHKAEKLDLLKNHIIYAIIYIALPTASLISLRSLPEGIDIIIYVLVVVWITDSLAYFGGKNFQGPKLAESISPNKTISGAMCGILATIIFSAISYFFTSNVNFFLFIFIGISLSIISQIGDLFESWVKRKLEVKDSGNLIPGHGGICDRVDGLLFVLPVAYFIFGFLNQNIF